MIKRQNLKHKHITSFQIIILGFLSVIILGSILLMLPVSTRDGKGAVFSDALFTATSAVCVTGLVIHDTATYWSMFGQSVILFLIQIGGMGIVTVAVSVAAVSGRKIGAYAEKHYAGGCFRTPSRWNCIIEIAVPEKWIGKTVVEADVRKKHGINIMAIKRDGKMNLNFAPETRFIPGDTILVLGDTKPYKSVFTYNFRKKTGIMKELLLVCAATAIIVFGYFVMKKLDAFLANNRRLIDTEIAENSLLIAFDNPMIIDSLMPLFEKFSKANPNCQLHFLFGNTEDIYDKLNKNRIDFGFIENNASANGDTYNCLIISTKQHSIICEQAGCTIEPLNPSGSQTAVVWKKASSNALVNSFSDLLLSNQAAINAEYVK